MDFRNAIKGRLQCPLWKRLSSISAHPPERQRGGPGPSAPSTRDMSRSGNNAHSRKDVRFCSEAPCKKKDERLQRSASRGSELPLAAPFALSKKSSGSRHVTLLRASPHIARHRLDHGQIVIETADCQIAFRVIRRDEIASRRHRVAERTWLLGSQRHLQELFAPTQRPLDVLRGDALAVLMRLHQHLTVSPRTFDKFLHRVAWHTQQLHEYVNRFSGKPVGHGVPGHVRLSFI